MSDKHEIPQEAIEAAWAVDDDQDRAGMIDAALPFIRQQVRQEIEAELQGHPAIYRAANAFGRQANLPLAIDDPDTYAGRCVAGAQAVLRAALGDSE